MPLTVPPDVWTAIAALIGAAAAALVAWSKKKSDTPQSKAATLDDVVSELKAIRETMAGHTSKLDILLDRTYR